MPGCQPRLVEREQLLKVIDTASVIADREYGLRFVVGDRDFGGASAARVLQQLGDQVIAVREGEASIARGALLICSSILTCTCMMKLQCKRDHRRRSGPGARLGLRMKIGRSADRVRASGQGRRARAARMTCRPWRGLIEELRESVVRDHLPMGNPRGANQKRFCLARVSEMPPPRWRTLGGLAATSTEPATA
jgi:hypothetical protein